MSLSLLIARLLLAGVFAIAGIAKLLDTEGTRKSMADFGTPGPLVTPLAWSFPLVELALAIALIPAASAWWAAIGVLSLLVLFSGAIGINLARGRRPDCHCFGQLHSEPVGWKSMVRNATLAALAGVVIWRGRESIIGVSDATARLGEFETALLESAVGLALLAAFQMWSLVHVLRQNGRLLLRLEALESRIGAPAALAVNSPAPSFRLEDLHGGIVTLEKLREPGKPLLLFFTEPGCGSCEAALPEVARWQSEFANRLSIIPISSGNSESNRVKIERHNIGNWLLQTKRETADSYRIEMTPSAVLVAGGLIASPVASGIDAIRSLVVRATLPPVVKKGDAAPSLQLADLKGTPVNIADLRGRRTLLLFWNPTCGFCQRMLPDVKAWERSRSEDALELVVVSAGAPEVIREQGFRARVFLDPHFAASQVFNSSGTPSAVMLDEHGLVASDVAVGGPQVLELAGATASAGLKTAT